MDVLRGGGLLFKKKKKSFSVNFRSMSRLVFLSGFIFTVINMFSGHY